MTNIQQMGELELRDQPVPWPETMEALAGYIEDLVKRDHDYGTCVYAMSMAATAAFYYVSKQLGVTGFQASCADMDILRRTRGLTMGFRILNYENLLYPQYCDEEHFPSWQTLVKTQAVELKRRALEKIEEASQSSFAPHPDVLAHWQILADLPAEGTT